MSDGSPKKDQPAPAETHGLDTISKGQLWFHILASLLTGRCLISPYSQIGMWYES